MGLLISILIFLLLSAIFSGSEIAFISANKLKVELQREGVSKSARIIASFYEKPKAFLSTMLVGNNIALVVFTYLMTKVLEPLVSSYISDEVVLLLLNTVLITIIVLIFGEFLPKTFFRLYANQMLLTLSYPLLIFKYILSVPSVIMTSLSNFMLRHFFGLTEEKVNNTFTQKDLEYLVSSNVASDLEYEIDTDLFTNALHLKTVKVKACMVPRTEIVAVDIDDPIEKLIEIIDETKISRIIVIHEDIENIKGYIHHQQLLSSPQTIKPLVLELEFVPETMSAEDLLNRFIQQSKNIACVVDEFGSVAGIITMEDILEELFGEIEDEHDEEDLIEEILDERNWLFSGRLEISDLNDKYESMHLKESSNYTTLSGYLIDILGDIPSKGDKLEDEDYEFIITEVSDTRIEVVQICKKEN